MSTSLGLPQSSPILDPNVPPPSSPALSQPPATQVIPGTTVIGTGTTGDVWSYTIPAITSIITSSEPATLPSSSSPAPTSVPEPSGTFVASEIIISRTTVVGGTETGIPWSYTIPAQSVATSVFVPFTISPTASPSESLSLTDSLTSTESPPPTTPLLPGYTEPVPRTPPDASHSVLSGGIVAAILMGLLLIMFCIAGCLCIRLRRRQREFEGAWEHVHFEKDIGAVWGRGWGREDKGGAWRKRQKMNNREYAGDGHTMNMGSDVASPAPAARFRQGLMGNPTPGNESAERLIERRDGGPSSLYSSTRPSTTPIIYPVNARYPQTRGPERIPEMDTRPSSSRPTQRTINTITNDDTNNNLTYNKPSTGKLKRPLPPPSPFVYAPPQEAPPEPAPQAAYSTNPFSTRPTSPYRAASPYGSHTSSGRNVLSKQRGPVLPPSTSAFMRHMLPTRAMSLRRPKAPSTVPPAPLSPTTAPAPAPARPGINSLPSFIRDRRFSPGTSRTGSKSTSHSGGESVIFSPSSRPATHLPSHAPARVSSPVSRSTPLAPPRMTNTRDRYLSPHGGRDRSSQLTSTTRSGGTGQSRDTRSTGPSAGSAISGRSGDSRVTGRSGDTRFTSRSRVLAQIPEGEPEPSVGRRGHDRPRRHEGP